MSKINDPKPYEELANAIVLQAVKDYRNALAQLDRYPRNKDAKTEKEECERFFRSGWFKALTEIDSEYLIRRLNEEVDA